MSAKWLFSLIIFILLEKGILLPSPKTIYMIEHKNNSTSETFRTEKEINSNTLCIRSSIMNNAVQVRFKPSSVSSFSSQTDQLPAKFEKVVITHYFLQLH